MRLEWFNDEIVVFNDQGTIFVFDNICPHRGARIFDAADGNRILRCGYHGWTFRNGRFHAPFPTEFAPEDLARAKFNTFETAWCGGFLFASEDPDMALQEQLDGLGPLLEQVSESIAAPIRCIPSPGKVTGGSRSRTRSRNTTRRWGSFIPGRLAESSLGTVPTSSLARTRSIDASFAMAERCGNSSASAGYSI